MQKITPHLWYNKEAKEAAKHYVSAFSDGPGESSITSIQTLHNTPSGDCDVVAFKLWGYSFMSISAGPYFKTNPSISFLVNFDPSQDKDARTRIDAVWEKLSKGGKELMPMGEYPFSERYGWIQDAYGVSWQLMLTKPQGEKRPFIIPFFMFVGDLCGKAKEATDFYLSVFKDTKRGTITTYPEGMEPDAQGTVMFTDFMLEKQWFAAMDSAHKHAFNFNEAVSLLVRCESQEEIDYYWQKLSAVPEAEQCGWLKDKYGVSWQIHPSALDKLLASDDQEKVKRVTEAFLKMKKFDILELQRVAQES